MLAARLYVHDVSDFMLSSKHQACLWREGLRTCHWFEMSIFFILRQGCLYILSCSNCYGDRLHTHTVTSCSTSPVHCAFLCKTGLRV